MDFSTKMVRVALYPMIISFVFFLIFMLTKSKKKEYVEENSVRKSHRYLQKKTSSSSAQQNESKENNNCSLEEEISSHANSFYYIPLEDSSTAESRMKEVEEVRAKVIEKEEQERKIKEEIEKRIKEEKENAIKLKREQEAKELAALNEPQIIEIVRKKLQIAIINSVNFANKIVEKLSKIFFVAKKCTEIMIENLKKGYEKIQAVIQTFFGNCMDSYSNLGPGIQIFNESGLGLTPSNNINQNNNEKINPHMHYKLLERKKALKKPYVNQIILPFIAALRSYSQLTFKFKKLIIKAKTKINDKLQNRIINPTKEISFKCFVCLSNFTHAVIEKHQKFQFISMLVQLKSYILCSGGLINNEILRMYNGIYNFLRLPQIEAQSAQTTEQNKLSTTENNENRVFFSLLRNFNLLNVLSYIRDFNFIRVNLRFGSRKIFAMIFQVDDKQKFSESPQIKKIVEPESQKNTVKKKSTAVSNPETKPEENRNPENQQINANDNSKTSSQASQGEIVPFNEANNNSELSKMKNINITEMLIRPGSIKIRGIITWAGNLNLGCTIIYLIKELNNFVSNKTSKILPAKKLCENTGSLHDVNETDEFEDALDCVCGLKDNIISALELSNKTNLKDVNIEVQILTKKMEDGLYSKFEENPCRHRSEIKSKEKIEKSDANSQNNPKTIQTIYKSSSEEEIFEMALSNISSDSSSTPGSDNDVYYSAECNSDESSEYYSFDSTSEEGCDEKDAIDAEENEKDSAEQKKI
ncbi:hypothetical protein EDEG_02839 [Edhazardia aedis USNM 41457]|uniref:Uncharacterized protein n=1 Tax=Edhazardia aedis (strain USNM 41457) TaxID=1003232 RepID=J8ZSX5_EDHAE|nr:hypothetical protein EDEG_02839 [Edhazardia aedis USNM 41457]|eukprot:EJW02768.1 hypothetical protein EDEG_02839 [Edhazardia aedis USNM 41457]